MSLLHFSSNFLPLLLGIGILPFLIGLALARLLWSGRRQRCVECEEALQKVGERRAAARAQCLELEAGGPVQERQ